MSTESRANRFKALCKREAKALGCKATDEDAQFAATIVMQREQITARLIAGDRVDAGDLFHLDEIRKALPKKMPTKFEIGFVRTSFENCPRCHESQPFVCRSCGHEETVEDHEARRARDLPPSVPPSPAPQIEAKPVAKSAVEPASNVVPLRPSEAPDCQPVFQVSQDWRSHVAPVGGGNCNPFSAAGDPNPNFGPGGRSRY